MGIHRMTQMTVDDSNQGLSAEVELERESFGTWLRNQRKLRRVDLRTITEASKINIRYLEALEQDRFDLLPAAIFVKGFLREYARVVGLDADEVLNFYLQVSAQEQPEPLMESTTSDSAWSVGRTVVLLLVLVAAGAALVWFGFSGLGRDDAGDIEPMAPPVVEPAPAEPTAESAEQPAEERALRVTIEFQATSWVDVFADDERTVSELRVQGESLVVSADREVRVQFGRVSAATIEVNGELLEHEAGDDEEIVIRAPE